MELSGGEVDSSAPSPPQGVACSKGSASAPIDCDIAGAPDLRSQEGFDPATSRAAGASLVVLELFGGLGTGCHLLQTLGVRELAAYISESGGDQPQRLLKVLRSHHPQAVIFPDVMLLAEGGWSLLGELVQHHREASMWLVIDGFPCQDLSSHGKRAGLTGHRSSLFAVVVFLLSRLRSSLPPETKVAHITENVANMPAECKRLLDRAFAVKARALDAATAGPASRKRLIWSNIRGVPDPTPAQVRSSSILDPGWARLDEVGLATVLPNHRWATFLRPLPPGQPPEWPSSFTHLSLSAYHAHNLVVRSSLTEQDKTVAQHWLQCGQAAHRQFQPAARGLLVEWIHEQGGSELIRPLCGHERGLALGFDPCVARVRGQPRPPLFSDEDWFESALYCNAFPPTVIQCFLAPVAAHLLHGHPLDLGPVPQDVDEPSDVFQSLGLEGPGWSR